MNNKILQNTKFFYVLVFRVLILVLLGGSGFIYASEIRTDCIHQKTPEALTYMEFPQGFGYKNNDNNIRDYADNLRTIGDGPGPSPMVNVIGYWNVAQVFYMNGVNYE